MSDPVIKELLHNIAASKAITTAAIEQGRIIGRREMKPLIRDLSDYLKGCMDALTSDSKNDVMHHGREILARAKEALEND